MSLIARYNTNDSQDTKTNKVKDFLAFRNLESSNLSQKIVKKIIRKKSSSFKEIARMDQRDL